MWVRLGNISKCTSKALPLALYSCYSCSSGPNLLDKGKNRVVTVLVLEYVLQRFAFSVHSECVQREKQREKGGRLLRDRRGVSILIKHS